MLELQLAGFDMACLLRIRSFLHGELPVVAIYISCFRNVDTNFAFERCSLTE